MSAFECPVVRVKITPHGNADSLELAQIGGYISIVKKGQFQNGDLAVYIPEQSVLPEWLLKQLGFWDDLNGKGKLSGSRGNRVRAMKLRGVLSQGLLYPVDKEVYDDGVAYSIEGGKGGDSGFDAFQLDAGHENGFNAAEWLGIVKYEPVVPAQMAGRVAGGDLDATIGYDFENIKKFPTLFEDDEPVVMTEKIHGTFVQVGLIPEIIWAGKNWADKLRTVVIDNKPFKAVVTSKGQGARGLLLDTADETNLYVKTATKGRLWAALAGMRRAIGVPGGKPIFLLGEIYGPGVQTGFAYGAAISTFRAFDIYVGTRSDGYFVDYDQMRELCGDSSVETVPLLYCGGFSVKALELHTDGRTRVDCGTHIREGLVVKSRRESKHPKFGRKIAKSLSEAYLLRKGVTTEFQ